jgi:hypothetical protein
MRKTAEEPMRSKTFILALTAAIAIGILSYCGRSPLAGNVTQTGNPVASMVYNPDGSPAIHAKVYFYPVNYNPHTGGLGKTAVTIDSTITDTNGNYVEMLDSGTYNILAKGDSGLAFQDSITVTRGDTVKPPADTLHAPGTIQGIVQLQPGDDARTVFILFMGTHTFTMPTDLIGNFTSDNMAAGHYSVRIITTTPNYKVLDTNLGVIAGTANVLPQPIVLQYTGIPVPTGLKINYDTLKQIVTLIWDKPINGRKVQSYTIYRKRSDSATFVNIKGGVTDTTNNDSTGVQDQTYEYRVAVVDTNTTEGTRSAGVQVLIAGMFTVADSIVKGYAIGVDGNFGQFGRGVLDSAGNFYITDNTNKWLQKLDPTGNFIFKITTMSEPIAITNYKDSALYACNYGDDGRKEILKASLQGNIDTVFPTIGRPSGVCARGDTVFVSSDSGIEIYNLIGTRLDSLPFAFISQPDIIAETNGNLYVVEDRGLFEVNLQSRQIRNIWAFKNANENQQARIAIYSGDTLVIIAMYTPQNPPPGPQSINTNLYMVTTNGNLIGRWYTKDFLSGITKDSTGRLVCFSDGRILFLHR